MDHLSGVDATFLYTETPETPMHVGSLNVYELPRGYEGDFVEDVRKHLAGRLHLAPVFWRKLLNMPFELANPVWVHDEDLDLEYHIRSTVLPKPGELGNVVEYLLTEKSTVAGGLNPLDLADKRNNVDVSGPIWSSLAFLVVVLGMGLLAGAGPLEFWSFSSMAVISALTLTTSGYLSL